MKKAMILAAGFGTRLKPLTDNTPKALVKINNKPLLDITIERLVRFGFNNIIVNVHHFGEQIIKHVKKYDNTDINIVISDEREKLLNTGGGLKKAAHFLQGDDFLIVNVDNITDLDLNKIYTDHKNSGALGTLAVRKRNTSRYLLFNENNQLCGWENRRTSEKIIKREYDSLNAWSFSSIHILKPEIFTLMPGNDVFSIIDFYLSICADHKLAAYPHDETMWMDVGRPESLAKAAVMLKSRTLL